MSSCEGEIVGVIVLWCHVAIDCEGEIAALMVLVAMLCSICVALCDVGVGSGKLVDDTVGWLGKGVVL